MNETISAVLRDHADGDIHIERLLGAVHAGARRRRRHRLVLAGGAVVMVAASVGVSGSMIQREQATVATPAPEIGVPRPPYMDGAPTAAQKPEVLGADPSLLHLDMTDMTGWKYLSWSSRRDHEELSITTLTDEQLLIETDRNPDRLIPRYGTPQPVTVNGLPAEAFTSGGRHVVRWQPIPGIWAQALAPGPVETVLGIAEQLRFDRVYRCAVPFRLTGVPPMRLVKCETFFGVDDATGDLVAGGGVWLGVTGSDIEYQVAIGKADPAIAVNDTIKGRAVEITEGNHGNPGSMVTMQIRYPYAERRAAYFWSFYEQPDMSLMRSLVAGITPVPGDDLREWPSNPLS